MKSKSSSFLKDQILPSLKAKSKRNKHFEDVKISGKESQKILNLMQEKKLEFQLDEEDESYSDDSDHSDQCEYNEEMPVEGLSKEELAAINSYFPSKVDLSSTIQKMVPLKENEDYDKQLQELYGRVGELLSKYTSGRLPSAFKFIPRLPNWEFYLQCTNPDKWTPHAHFHASRIYISIMKPYQATIYMKYLLYAVRKDILKTKKLNYHLYMALKKALYKPAVFFKGLLFPLCEQQCTLKEAVIISSIINKCTVPVMHSCAAILKLATMPYSGATSIFLRVLLDKKYALPYKVLDAMVNHFLQFTNFENEMTVLWHQSLLVFCQRYKNDFSDAQIEAFLNLISKKKHYLISGEIKRELMQNKSNMDLDPDTLYIDVVMEE
eukprot:NODE_181_length_15774_cov_0.163892.p5 type:complete len:380 gc:universal NODE_181_length_15774_cov_0.163892:13479-12340(-)